MKKIAKALIVAILGWQVRRLHKKRQFKIIAVVGSIGKTSTKMAIAQVLSEGKRVQYQQGNYNDIVSVPLIFFGHELPSLLNPIAWLKIFISNEKKIAGEYPYDYVVVELGTDGPGQIAAFKRYITADIAVVTAITPEHMENFAGLTAVAEEELAVATFSKRLLINVDLCPSDLTYTIEGSFLSYGITNDATYRMEDIAYSLAGSSYTLTKDRTPFLQGKHQSFSEPQLYSLTAAIAISDLLATPHELIIGGLTKVQPISGRMQLLNGAKYAKIIDDSYNASPDAVRAALKTLYQLPAPQKIALLGNMNELGTFSSVAHADVGKYCDPEHVDLVVTLGQDANTYLAEAAEKNGCKVVRTTSPYEAGKVIIEQLLEGGLVLVKGSQNGVFAEEAIKSLLADPADQSKLVRQSAYWLRVKKSQFKNESTPA